jgi:hypothetical protein
MWNRRDFHLINILENGRKFSVMPLLTEISSPLSELSAFGAPKSDRKFIVHADNTRPHTARRLINFLKDNRIETASRPPCSCDITPSDFYLSGYVKGCLASQSFVDAEEPFEAV